MRDRWTRLQLAQFFRSDDGTRPAPCEGASAPISRPEDAVTWDRRLEMLCKCERGARNNYQEAGIISFGEAPAAARIRSTLHALSPEPSLQRDKSAEEEDIP